MVECRGYVLIQLRARRRSSLRMATALLVSGLIDVEKAAVLDGGLSKLTLKSDSLIATGLKMSARLS